LVLSPTRELNIFDLLLTTNPYLLHEIQTHPPLDASDHDVVGFQMYNLRPTGVCSKQNNKPIRYITVWNSSSVNSAMFFLNYFYWNIVFNENHDPDKVWHFFRQVVLNAVNHFGRSVISCPNSKPNGLNYQMVTAWQVKKLCNHKTIVWRELKASNTPSHKLRLWKKYNAL